MEIIKYKAEDIKICLFTVETTLLSEDEGTLINYLVGKWCRVHGFEDTRHITVKKRPIIFSDYTQTREIMKEPPTDIRSFDVVLLRDLGSVHENSKKAWNILTREWSRYFTDIYVLTISWTYALSQLHSQYYREHESPGRAREPRSPNVSDETYEDLLTYIVKARQNGQKVSTMAALKKFGLKSKSGLYNYVHREYGEECGVEQVIEEKLYLE